MSSVMIYPKLMVTEVAWGSWATRRMNASRPAVLIKALECADQGYISPNSRTVSPNGRITFKGVEGKVVLPVYVEDTVKQ